MHILRIGGASMLLGGPVRSFEDIPGLEMLGFDFGEITFSGPASRRRWWESGVRSEDSGFLLVAHGPTVMDDPGDLRYLWSIYVPELLATIDTARRMNIRLLTIHLSVDGRVFDGFALAEKIRALRELASHGMKNKIQICLENITESAQDLAAVFSEVPNLGLTLDVGHAALCHGPENCMEILTKLRPFLKHVHLHDNHGGSSQADDLHLAVGDGCVDFRTPLTELVRSGYGGGLTLEVGRTSLEISIRRVQSFIAEVGSKDISC